MDRKIRRKLRRIWEYIKVFSMTLLAMAAGAATYHQYIIQHKPTPELMKEIVETGQIDMPALDIQEAVLVEVDEPEEGEDELKDETETDELELLAICIEAEAGNQDIEGKRMVADVILNRVRDKDFPNTITEVISQPYQFSSYWDGNMERIKEPSEETVRVTLMELEEVSWPGLFYFTAEGYSKYGTPWKKVGDHYFSTK